MCQFRFRKEKPLPQRWPAPTTQSSRTVGGSLLRRRAKPRVNEKEIDREAKIDAKLTKVRPYETMEVPGLSLEYAKSSRSTGWRIASTRRIGDASFALSSPETNLLWSRGDLHIHTKHSHGLSLSRRPLDHAHGVF